MEVAGTGSAPAGMESRRMDDNPVREEQKQPEERPSISQLVVQHGLQTESPENFGKDDCNAVVEDPQRNNSRLRHLSCKFDSTTSLSSLLEGKPVDVLDESGKTALHYAAEQHAVRCIEFLLKRRAKPDIKSTNGLIALEIALQSDRMQNISWSPADQATELLTLIGDKDLAAIKILADHTRDLDEVASRLIVHGNIVAFAALLIVAGDAIIGTSVLNTDEHGDGTLFDILVKKALSTGEQVQDHDPNSNACYTADTKYNLRQILLKELALFLRWYLDHDESRDNRHRTPPTSSVPSPLLRAAQAGDIAVVEVLIEHEADVNETDSGGNTALHWSLRATTNTKDIRVVLKLLRHGASITMGNRLGLTPVHIAAGQGHVRALQILLAVEPSSVDVAAETKETPLFSAVKGNHYECVRVLLQHGASRQVLNLRKQRPIDVAETSDMRALLYLQESSGRGNDLHPMRPPSLDGNYAGFDYETELLKFRSNTCPPGFGYPDERYWKSAKALMKELGNWRRHIIIKPYLKAPIGEKTEMCRYFSMPGGCVRGEKCFYAHREEDLQGRPKSSTDETKALVAFNSCMTPTKLVKEVRMAEAYDKVDLKLFAWLWLDRVVKRQRVSEDLSKKIFVGGLSPSVESDDLREFFEGKFGAVVDAIVIGSHSGDHVQSRGFGFVTFKNEDSVIAAVQAHYVNIFGKKVEIKGAVPRSVLPTLECVKGGLELSTPSSAESSKFSEIDLTKVHDIPSLELLCQAKGDLQVQLMNYFGHQAENGEPLTAQLQGVLSSVSPRVPCATGQDVAWVTKFKKWLPKFLVEVSNRLKEGEWYPLSSLKGDFRATCGLELDHVAIGYHKLSDFVRSIPESCRMKIVPVGRGPATHMVLLPALARLTSSLTVQTPTLTGLTAYSALVDAGRSYAAATCELPGRSTSVSSVNTRSLIPHLKIGGNSTGQFESHKVYNSNSPLPRSRYEEARLPDKSSTQNHTPLVDTPEGSSMIPPISQDQFGVHGNLMQEADRSNLRDLLALMDNCEGNHGEDRVPTSVTDLIANNSNNARDNAGPTFTAPSGGAVATSTDSLVDSRQDDPKTPVILRPFSTFNHPFSGFLPQNRVNNYSMWGRYPGQQSQTSQISANPNPIAVKSSPHNLSWDDSPQSVLHPYGRTYSQIGSQETPRSLFSPGGNSPTNEKPWAAICVYCRERQSLWVAIPCNHCALCAVCKDALQKLSRNTINCPVCTSHVERWIALHY